MTDLTKDEVLKVAYVFRLHAEHFAQDDWEYTRTTSIKHIRYEGDYKGYSHPFKRVQRTARNIFFKDSLSRLFDRPAEKSSPLKERLAVKLATLRAKLKVGLRTDSHRPDGVLDGGNIITHWEETGEYLQFVQPSVGSLLADFLEANPTHPSAVAIAGEMKRIIDAYAERLGQESSLPELQWVTVNRKRYPVIVHDWTEEKDLGYLSLTVLQMGKTKAQTREGIKDAVMALLQDDASPSEEA